MHSATLTSLDICVFVCVYRIEWSEDLSSRQEMAFVFAAFDLHPRSFLASIVFEIASAIDKKDISSGRFSSRQHEAKPYHTFGFVCMISQVYERLDLVPLASPAGLHQTPLTTPLVHCTYHRLVPGRSALVSETTVLVRGGSFRDRQLPIEGLVCSGRDHPLHLHLRDYDPGIRYSLKTSSVRPPIHANRLQA
jgi:hypothetical protein